MTMTNWTPKRIKALRTQLGLTQAELAERLGLPTYDGSAPRVADLESGRRTPSGPVQKLLDHFEQSADHTTFNEGKATT